MNVDWSELFTLSMPLSEIVIRGSATYLFLFLIFRFIVQRDIGAVGLADILILVIVADASQNAMAGEYKSVTDGMVLVLTLIFWNRLFDWLSYRFNAFRRFAEPPLLCLISDGRMLKRNMRKEYISEEELWVKLREQGITELHQVKKAFLEPDGAISVIKREG
ncbi:MAG TPA: YetF domain-containing protein [Burkholderiaceae bacterium]|jgi:uncharacterized membrane protein YcaP (DUF421 family)|nr:YetF domain-containing protein [Burkholderiaceae bacterium]